MIFLKDSVAFQVNVVAKLFLSKMFEDGGTKWRSLVDGNRHGTWKEAGEGREGGRQGGGGWWGGPCDRPKTACRCKLFLLRNKWKRALLVEKEMGKR